MRDVESKIHVVGGNKVRSLLEKRWVMFFKLLDIPFEYEPERFPDGISSIGYLPDIVIHERLYLEIKPTYEIAIIELDKPCGFVRTTGKRLMLVIGDPPGEFMIAIIANKNGGIETKYIRDVSWETLNQHHGITRHREQWASMKAINDIDYSMATPIARCLDIVSK